MPECIEDAPLVGDTLGPKYEDILLYPGSGQKNSSFEKYDAESRKSFSNKTLLE